MKIKTTEVRAAQRNYGLYGGSWGHVGPNRYEQMSECLRDELQARQDEADRRAYEKALRKKPAQAAGSGA